MAADLADAKDQVAKDRAVIERFQALYLALRADTLHLLDGVYADTVIFEDPLHRVEGLAELKHYFQRMYAGVESISFEYGEVFPSAGQAMLTWTMHMTHRRLQGGEPLTLPGATHIRFARDKVLYHRDYFDAGALLYERLPVLGSVVRAVRRRV